MPPRSQLPPASELPPRLEFPDPLRMLDGTRIETVQDWLTRRRPELQRLFRHYMYGQSPPPPPLEFRVESASSALGGKATLKLVTIEFVAPYGVPPIEVLLVLPARRSGPVPAFLGINFAGNHTLLADPAVPEARCHQLQVHPRAARGAAASSWNVEQIIDRGYALASFHTCDVKPDRPHAGEGVQRYFVPVGSDAPYDWAALRIWAWACSRVLDYLQADPDVDARRVAVVGHSRLGKAALLAGAFDERFALTIALQSGCGGAAPSRGSVGESVRQINQAFPHWFNAEFKTFNDEPARLPFDQHCLLALIAPRPLLLANAAEDTWANPVGQFEALRAAEPVYRLVRAGGLESEHMPAPGQLSAGSLGYFLRAGTHSMTTQDWAAFLDYADRNCVPRSWH
jgi:hypothetical protein